MRNFLRTNPLRERRLKQFQLCPTEDNPQDYQYGYFLTPQQQLAFHSPKKHYRYAIYL